MPLLLLSKSSPLRWVSVWFLREPQLLYRHSYQTNRIRTYFQSVMGSDDCFWDRYESAYCPPMGATPARPRRNQKGQE